MLEHGDPVVFTKKGVRSKFKVQGQWVPEGTLLSFNFDMNRQRVVAMHPVEVKGTVLRRKKEGNRQTFVQIEWVIEAKESSLRIRRGTEWPGKGTKTMVIDWELKSPGMAVDRQSLSHKQSVWCNVKIDSVAADRGKGQSDLMFVRAFNVRSERG